MNNLQKIMLSVFVAICVFLGSFISPLLSKELPIKENEPVVVDEKTPKLVPVESVIAEEKPLLIPRRTSDKITEENVWIMINEKRVEHGVDPIPRNSTLDEVASEKTNDMVEHEYLSHVDPEGQKIYKSILDHGYRYRLAGENLAVSYVSLTELVDAWMSSEKHRENILNPRFEEIGIGVSSGDWRGYENIFFITTIFGSKD